MDFSGGLCCEVASVIDSLVGQVPLPLGLQVIRFPKNCLLNPFENSPKIARDSPLSVLLANLRETVITSWQMCQWG